jgi:hypothetical protein
LLRGHEGAESKRQVEGLFVVAIVHHGCQHCCEKRIAGAHSVADGYPETFVLGPATVAPDRAPL